MQNDDEIQEQLKLLKVNRQTLAHYLKQQGLFGSAYAPPNLANGIIEARKNIQSIKASLRREGVVVEDLTIDQEASDLQTAASERVRQSDLSKLSIVFANMLSLILTVTANYATSIIPEFLKPYITWSWVVLLSVFGLSVVYQIWPRAQDSRLMGRYSGADLFLKEYLIYIVKKHRYFDDRFLETPGKYVIDLDEIFVELRMSSQSINNLNKSMIKQITTRDHFSMWDFLSSPVFQEDSFVIVGPPGSGKSTLLRNTATVLAKTYINGKSIKKMSKYIPVTLLLREIADDILENENIHLSGLITNEYNRKNATNISEDLIRKSITSKNCLVMLDGLDEITTDRSRQAVSAWIDRLIVSMPNSRFVITSRPQGYVLSPLKNVNVLEVCPFSMKQVEKFVMKWYFANTAKDRQSADAVTKSISYSKSTDLISRIRQTTSLSELSVNPLLLTMIITIHRYRGELPKERIELYDEIFKVFLVNLQELRRQSTRGRFDADFFILKLLAFEMMVARIQEIDILKACELIDTLVHQYYMDINPSDYLKYVENSSGLILEKEPGVYGFAHLTFQEYLAALYLSDGNQISDIIKYIGDGWWIETIRLYASRNNASKVIEACLVAPSADAISLAIECAEETAKLDASLRERIDDILDGGFVFGEESWRKAAAHAVLQSRLRHLARIDDTRYVDVRPISVAEYDLFLSDIGINHLVPDHWTNLRYKYFRARNSIAGLRPTDVSLFCNWLTEKQGGTYNIRPPKSTEIKEINILGEYYLNNENKKGYWITSTEGVYLNSSIADDSEHSYLLSRVQEDVKILALPLLCVSMGVGADILVTYISMISKIVSASSEISKDVSFIRIIEHELSRNVGQDRMRLNLKIYVDQFKKISETIENSIHNLQALGDFAYSLRGEISRDLQIGVNYSGDSNDFFRSCAFYVMKRSEEINRFIDIIRVRSSAIVKDINGLNHSVNFKRQYRPKSVMNFYSQVDEEISALLGLYKSFITDTTDLPKNITAILEEVATSIRSLIIQRNKGQHIDMDFVASVANKINADQDITKIINRQNKRIIVLIPMNIRVDAREFVNNTVENAFERFDLGDSAYIIRSQEGKWGLRLYCLFVAISEAFAFAVSDLDSYRGQKKSTSIDTSWINHLKIYTTLVTIEGRSAGTITPSDSIRIIKELVLED